MHDSREVCTKATALWKVLADLFQTRQVQQLYHSAHARWKVRSETPNKVKTLKGDPHSERTKN